MTGEQYRSYPKQLLMRQVAVDARDKNNRVQQFKVVTTILTPSIDGQQIAALYEHRWAGEVFHADYDEKDNLYRGGRWAYSSRACVVEAGPLVPAMQALRFRRKPMRSAKEGIVPPAPARAESARPAEAALGGTAADRSSRRCCGR